MALRIQQSASRERPCEEAFTRPFTRRSRQSSRETRQITRPQAAWAWSRSVLIHCADTPVGTGKYPMKHTESVIHSDLEIMGGTPVFVDFEADCQRWSDLV